MNKFKIQDMVKNIMTHSHESFSSDTTHNHNIRFFIIITHRILEKRKINLKMELIPITLV